MEKLQRISGEALGKLKLKTLDCYTCDDDYCRLSEGDKVLCWLKLVAQAQLKADLKAHNAVIREKDSEIMRLKEEIQMHEKTLQQLWESGQTIRG